MGLLRRNWLVETRLLCGAAVTAGVVFAVTPLDIAVERVFYRVGADHWPLARFLLFSILYRLAPFITASLLLVGLIAWDRPRPRDVLEFGGTGPLAR